MPLSIEQAAEEIVAAMANRRSIAPLTDSDPGLDVRRAYAISAEIHRRRLADGWRSVGRKIGFTNRGIWAEYGVDSPMWGYVYDRTVVYGPECCVGLSVDHLCEPRIEPEIVLHFGRTPAMGADEAGILECIDWIAHGFEIVQSVFPAWKFKAVDTMAQAGLHGALVVGPPQPVAGIADVLLKLRTFGIDLSKNGSFQASGSGANVLGSPLLAFAFLSKTLAELPGAEPVAAGEIVTTGTLTPAFPITTGEAWSTTLSGIELPGMTLTVL